MLYALIMAGGRGTRFWPRSRAKTPKQLQTIVGNKTMLQATVDRISPLAPPERILIAPGRALVPEVRRQIPGLPPENLLIEPTGRDTAPCIALAAAVLRRKDPDAVMVVLPADHVISDKAGFRQAVKAAAGLAAKETCLVTLGLKVTRPETGYGYIEMGKKAGQIGKAPYYQVKRFTEKPSAQNAKRYQKSKNYYWNSGMFIWSVKAIGEEINRLLPDTYKKCESIAGAKSRAAFTRRMNRIFPTISPISIDYGVMEKAKKIYGFATDIGWSDVGNWNSLAEVLPADSGGNVCVGELLGLSAKGLIVHSPKKLVAAVGVDDLVIVDTPDALLVCHKDQTQRLREVVAELEKRGKKDLL